MIESKVNQRGRDYWYRHISSCIENKETLVSYAKEHSLNVGTMYRWKIRFHKEGIFKKRTSNKFKFKRVRIEEENLSKIEYKINFPNGISIEISGGVTTENIKLLIQNWL